MLKERKAELPEESLRQDAVHAIKERSGRHIHVIKDPQPQGLMGKKQGFETIEGGGRDPRTLTDLLYAGLVEKASPQDNKDESEGIRRIRYKGAWEQGVGMTAGTAPVPFYDHIMDDGMGVFPLHQIARIESKGRQIGFRAADRTDAVRMSQIPCFHLKPLPVGKRYLVQLAKNSKRTYHKYGDSY